MNTIFKIDGKFLEGLDKITNIIVLNLLCIIGCIPVITLGASITATYAIAMKLAKDEECYIIKDYFKISKNEFKKSTILWIVMMFTMIILIMDFYIAGMITNRAISSIFIFIFTTISVILVFVSTYIFALSYKFKSSIKNTLINATVISVQSLPYTAILILINFLPIIMIMIFYNYFAYIIFFYVSIGFGLNIYINSFILNKVFEKYIEK